MAAEIGGKKTRKKLGNMEKKLVLKIKRRKISDK